MVYDSALCKFWFLCWVVSRDVYLVGLCVRDVLGVFFVVGPFRWVFLGYLLCLRGLRVTYMFWVLGGKI